MAKRKSKKWRFSKKRYSQSSIKNGTVILVEGDFLSHTSDGNVIKVNGLVGKKTGSHVMHVFRNRRNNTAAGLYAIADNEKIRVKLKNRKRKK